MAGIEDLKLWRSESMPDEWIKFNPNHPTLGWKYPYQGRWYTSNLDFVRDWMGSGNIIKELDIKSPIPLSKEFQSYPRHWTSDTWRPQYTAKTITELLDDIKTLKKWVPTEGMGSRLDQLDQSHPFRDLYGKVINNPYDKPLKTKFEYFMRHPNLKKMISLVPDKKLADTGSVNVWESIKKNLWRPGKYGGIFTGGNESWIKGILNLPKKIKYLNQLKQANVPMHSGINWRPAANVGINTLRGVGLAGDALLGAMALSDVFAGTSTVGNMAKNINKWVGVPYKDDGTVWTNTQDYENFMNPPSPAVGQPGGPPVERFNRGGIVSLML